MASTTPQSIPGYYFVAQEGKRSVVLRQPCSIGGTLLIVRFASLLWRSPVQVACVCARARACVCGFFFSRLFCIMVGSRALVCDVCAGSRGTQRRAQQNRIFFLISPPPVFSFIFGALLLLYAINSSNTIPGTRSSTTVSLYSSIGLQHYSPIESGLLEAMAALEGVSGYIYFIASPAWRQRGTNLCWKEQLLRE